MNKKRALQSGLTLIVALAISAGIAFLQISAFKGENAQTGTGVAGIEIGGPFSVQDQNGKPFTNKDLLGRYSLIYLGFTSCPAICPTELQKMNIALTTAGKTADKVQPIFITIDPERDTRKVLADYVAQFNPRMLGLGGTQAQIDAVEKAFHVYARRVDDPRLSDYTMDHSSYIYWVGPDGKIIALYGPTSTASEIGSAIQKTLTP